MQDVADFVVCPLICLLCKLLLLQYDQLLALLLHYYVLGLGFRCLLLPDAYLQHVVAAAIRAELHKHHPKPDVSYSPLTKRVAIISKMVLGPSHLTRILKPKHTP